MKMTKSHRSKPRLEAKRAPGMALLLLMCGVLVVASAGCPPKDKTPPGAVTNLTADNADSQVELSWTNPGDDDLKGVLVVRKVGSYPASRSDGETRFNGLGETFLDTGLTNGETYYYAVYAYDEVPNYSAAAQALGQPLYADANPEAVESAKEIAELLEDPSNPIPPEDLAELAEKLEDALGSFRGGDLCEAADKLTEANGYLPAVQGVRNDLTQPFAEELYNLGLMFRYNMLAGLLLKAQCPGHERVGMEAAATLDEAQSDNTQTIGLADFGEPKVRTVKQDGKVFTELVLPGADAGVGEPGVPAVPMFRRLVAVPIGAEVGFEFDAEPAETIKVNLFPFQEQPVDQNPEDPGDPPDPSVFDNKPFAYNADIYGSDAVWPPEPVTLTSLGSMRDLRMFLLEVAGGQYNPATDELTLYKNVDVDIQYYGGKALNFLTEFSTGPFESNPELYKGSVLNASKVGLYVGGVILPQILGEEFMILTHPDFLDAANTLAAWKREKGITTNVYTCGTGSDIEGRETNEEIDDFIESHYNGVAIRPSYILLLGDAEFIAPFNLNGVGSDWPYAILGSLASDLIPDFGLGRIPVDTLTQANTVVNKIINYEKTPPTDNAFYSHATVASQFQCCRDDVAQSGVDWRTFIEVSEFARNVMQTAGKTVDRIYTKTGPAATVPNRYYDLTLLPADLRSGSGYAWAGTTTDITNAWNAGRFLMIHRDHGWEGGWSHPSFSYTSADALTNGSLLPVVFSVNCSSGLFDNETAGGVYGTTATGVYFSERLLRKANGGAVGILGDTRDSPSWPNTALLKGFMDAIWPSALPAYGTATVQRRLGDILNHGKLFMLSQIPVPSAGVILDDALFELRAWHVLGDPTMEIWRNNPSLLVLAPGLLAELLESAVLVAYSQEGAQITVYQNVRGTMLRPIGRGSVKGGSANIGFFNTPVSINEYPLQYAISYEDAISVKGEEEKPTAK